MKQGIFEIIENIALTKSVFQMRLRGDTSAITASGQFVNIKLDGLYLRRPISVCDYDNDSVTIIYKVVGVGTEAMSHLPIGTQLDVLTVLGNGYDLTKAGDAPLLVGGGVGVPPMYLLAKKLITEGKKVQVILGFNTKTEVFYEEEFKALGATVLVATADGSQGVKGFVTDAMVDVARLEKSGCMAQFFSIFMMPQPVEPDLKPEIPGLLPAMIFAGVCLVLLVVLLIIKAKQKRRRRPRPTLDLS